MDCDQYLELISAALDGECTAGERRQLEDHLAVCPQCAQLFSILSANAEAVRELDCDVPADLKNRIMGSLPEQEKPAGKGKVIRWKRWLPVAAAACLVLVVSLLPMGGNSGTNEAAPNSADAPMSGMMVERYTLVDSAGDYLAEPAEPCTSPDETETAEPAPGSYVSVDAASEGLEPAHYAFENQRSIRLSGLYRPNAIDHSAVIIGSVEALESYLDALEADGQELTEDLHTLKSHYSFYNLLGFFENHRLLCVLVEAPSSGDRFQLAPQGLYRDKVIVEQTEDDPNIDMGYWLIVAEVDAMFEDGDTLEVSIDEVYDQYFPIEDIWVARKPSRSTPSFVSVIQNMDELVEYLETYAYRTDSATGELIRDPETKDLISIYGTPITEQFFERETLLAFTMIAPVHNPEYEVLTVNAEAVTIRQDHYQTGDLSGSCWLILVQAHGDFDPDNPPELIVTDGYP